MKSYVNATRYNAIVTLRIDSIADVEVAVEVGTPGASEKFPAVPDHYYDFFVPPGKQLRLVNNTSATFITVRTAP